MTHVLMVIVGLAQYCQFCDMLKHFKAVYSVKTKTKANLSRKHWLNYWHRCNHRCKRRLMHEIDALDSISIIQQYMHML